MSEKQYRDQIDRLTKEIAALHRDDAAAKKAATKARGEASTRRSKINAKTSATMARSHESSAKSADRRAETAEAKIKSIADKLAGATKKLNTAENNLAKAIEQRRRKTDREDAGRRRTELDHARRVSQMSRTVVHHVHEVRALPQPQAEALRVLYLTSNPLIDDPGTVLRVDAEVAQVQRAVRGALHRDYIKISPRPAARPEDLLDGLNDLRPHVVHFSGHADDGDLVMDNSDLDDPRRVDLTLSQLGRALGTIDVPPVLVVLNACDTADKAGDEILPFVPVVVAMAGSVHDNTAGVFAARFYAAITAGLSIKKAFDQAQLFVELAGLDEDSWMITLVHRDDVDPDDVVLVRPPSDLATPTIQPPEEESPRERTVAGW